MMDPFSMMMGMGFDDDDDDALEMMAIQEFAAKNVKMLKSALLFLLTIILF